MKRHHKEIAAKIEKANKQIINSEADQSSANIVETTEQNNVDDSIIVKLKISKSEVIAGFVDLVTLNGRPFIAVEDSGLNKIAGPILKALNLTINSENIKNHIVEAAQILRNKIRDEVKDKMVCIKTDSATRLDRNFLGVNIQYIHNAKLQLRTLAVQETEYSHTGKNLKNAILAIARDFEIEKEQMYSVTTDNARNMLSISCNLNADKNEELVNERIIDDTSSDNENSDEDDIITLVDDLKKEFDVQSMRCGAHSLQLGVNDVLKQKHIQKLLKNARSLIKELRKPSMKPLLRIYSLNKPSIDCLTRWSSTSKMLDDLLQCKALCLAVQETNTKLKLNDGMWNEIEELATSLKPAKIATASIQSEQLVVGDFYGIMYKCVVDTRETYTTFGDELCTAIESRMNTLYDIDCFVASLCLDPRYRVVLTREKLNYAKNFLQNLWNVRNRNYIINECPDTSSEVLLNENEVDVIDQMLQQKFVQQSSSVTRHSNNKNIASLIDEFHSLPLVDRKTDLLQWWETNKFMYPELYSLALIVHSLPVTQVSVERLFSGLKFVFSDLRGSMHASILNDVMLHSLEAT